MKLINKTGVPNKTAGDGLSHKDVNNINNAVNEVIEAVNDMMKDECNINAEVNDYEKVFNLETATRVVPREKRRYGMQIKFLNAAGSWAEYLYVGKHSLDDIEWTKEANWDTPLTVIDGGEW